MTLSRFALVIAIAAVSGAIDTALNTCAAGTGTVPVLQWQQHKPFALFLSNRTTPVILRGTAVDRWPARTKWTLDYILDAAARQDDRLGGFYRQRGNPVFGPFYDPARPMHQLESVQRINPYEEDVSLPVEEVHDKLTASSEDVNEFHMLSRNPSSISPALFVDIEPVEEFISLSDRFSANLWLGQPRATTPCHYDGYMNMYAHLRGLKRFYLLPSARWKEAYTYPLLHPSYGQCQANLTAPNHNLYPAAKPLHDHEDALVADLEPGDLLYLPPFWLHEVVTVSSSISVNFWTDVPQTKVSETVMQHPIPGLQIAGFSGVSSDKVQLWPDHTTQVTLPALAQPPARLLLAAHLLLSTLAIALAYDIDRLERIIHDVATFRYGPLIEQGILLGMQSQDRDAVEVSLCQRIQERLHAYRARDALISRKREMERVFLDQLGADPRLVEHLTHYQRRVAPLLAELADDASSADVWLANFVELVALRAFGTSHASLFIQAISYCVGRL